MSMTKTKQEPMKLSIGERAAIIEQTRDYETVLKNESRHLQDSAALRQRMAKNKAILAKDETLIARGRQKDKIAAEIKMLVEKVNRMRPTRRMIDARPGTQEFDQAVRINVEFQRVYTPMMLRIKSLKRRLEPDDPMSGNLERIRPT